MEVWKLEELDWTIFDICNKAELISIEDAQNPMLNRLLQKPVDELHICNQRSSSAPIESKSSKTGTVQPQAALQQEEEKSNILPIAMRTTMPPNFTNIQNPSRIMLAPDPFLQQAMYATIMNRMVMGKTKKERMRIIANILTPCIAQWFPESDGFVGRVIVKLLDLRDIDPLVLTYDSKALTIKMHEVVDILMKKMKKKKK